MFFESTQHVKKDVLHCNPGTGLSQRLFSHFESVVTPALFAHDEDARQVKVATALATRNIVEPFKTTLALHLPRQGPVV